MNQKYITGLQNSIKNEAVTAWDLRIEKCAKHLITAVCFRESAENARLKAEGVLLAPIGYYYSLFHLGVAMLTVDYSTTFTKIKKMKHQPLENMLVSNLLERNLIDEDFILLLNKYRNIREYANYQFGQFEYDFFTEIENSYAETEVAFDVGTKYILEVCNAIPDQEFLLKIQTYIGDHKGDDLMKTYLSPHEQSLVRNYLNKKKLTT